MVMQGGVLGQYLGAGAAKLLLEEALPLQELPHHGLPAGQVPVLGEEEKQRERRGGLVSSPFPPTVILTCRAHCSASAWTPEEQDRLGEGQYFCKAGHCRQLLFPEPSSHHQPDHLSKGSALSTQCQDWA